jgi:hypothetical protein
MAISGWLVVTGVCLLYVALGLWAVSQIFPTDHDPPPAPAPHSDRHEESSRT